MRTEALELLACDTIERIRHGMRRYLVTFIDPVSHFAFATALPSKHARHTARALDRGLSLLPQRPRTVLSDNGSQFQADFGRLLEERGIGRWYIYPKTPKMNARRALIARFKNPSWTTMRTCSSPTSLCSTASSPTGSPSTSPIPNPQSPSLGQLSPLPFPLKHQPDCQRDWTHTHHRQRALF